jgi:hypothetical protein
MAFTANRAHHAHRGEVSQLAWFMQPLGLVRRPVPAMPGDAPPVHAGVQLVGQRRYVLSCLQPGLGPGKNTGRRQRQSAHSASRTASPAPIRDGSGRL